MKSISVKEQSTELLQPKNSCVGSPEKVRTFSKKTAGTANKWRRPPPLKIQPGRTEAKYLELFKLLSEAIITNWKPEVFDINLLTPTLGTNNDKIGYNKSWIYEY
jgi:hypothetical protein